MTSMNQIRPESPAKPTRHFVSGLSSGVTSAVILQPLDLLKTRMQQSSRKSLSETIRDLRTSKSVVPTLWRGTVPSALRTGLGSALYFTTLNSIRQKARHASIDGIKLDPSTSSSALPTLSNSANLLSGAAARTFAGFVLMPLTVIKVRFESSLYSYQSVLSAAQDIRRTHGYRGFFSGFGATALRDAPYAGMYVFTYEMLKRRLGAIATSSTTSPTDGSPMRSSVASTVNASSAVLAGALCSAISNPFDAVKTRIQLQPDQFRNIRQAFGKMIIEDGVRSLFKGLGLRMSRKVLSSALAWTVYEELIRRASAR